MPNLPEDAGSYLESIDDPRYLAYLVAANSRIKVPARQKIKEQGENGEAEALTAEYEKKIAKAALPGEADEEARRELTRLKGMHPSSAEHSVIKTCLDELPQEVRQEMTIRLADRVEEAFTFALQPDGSGAAGSREKMPDLG